MISHDKLVAFDSSYCTFYPVFFIRQLETNEADEWARTWCQRGRILSAGIRLSLFTPTSELQRVWLY